MAVDSPPDGRCREGEATIAIRLQSIDVEHRMDLQRRRQVELVGIGVDDAFDLERTKVLESELRCALLEPSIFRCSVDSSTWSPTSKVTSRRC